MPIQNYDGETYVAFLDISGFKEMMRREHRAKEALNKFYTTIYNIGRNLHANNEKGFLEVNSLVISDCMILFSRNAPGYDDKIKGLRSILCFIQQVNRDLIAPPLPLMTTCSIDYGRFRYEDRIEFEGIEKGYFVGQPYVNAFLDNEKLKEPGKCRLVKGNIENICDPIDLLDTLIIRGEPPFSLLEETGKCYYFHWMLNSLDDLMNFDQEYQDTYQLKYAGMIQVLQKYVTE